MKKKSRHSEFLRTLLFLQPDHKIRRGSYTLTIGVYKVESGGGNFIKLFGKKIKWGRSEWENGREKGRRGLNLQKKFGKRKQVEKMGMGKVP